MISILQAKTDNDMLQIRELFQEYADSLGIHLEFQNSNQEPTNLPGQYAPPKGRSLLALYDDRPAGCIAA